MARGGVDPIVRYAVLGGLGFVGWNWANSQPAGSWPRQTVDQARAFFKHPSWPTASSSTAPPHAAHPAGVAQVWQKYQWHDDRKCWLDTGYSDGHVDSQLADNDKCPMLPGVWYGAGGAPVDTPTPIPTNQSMQATTLVDLGGFPLVLDPNQDALRQDPAQGGTNVYGPGDLVLNSVDGSQWQIVSTRGGVLLAGADGAMPAVDQFFT